LDGVAASCVTLELVHFVSCGAEVAFVREHADQQFARGQIVGVGRQLNAQKRDRVRILVLADHRESAIHGRRLHASERDDERNDQRQPHGKRWY